MPAGRIGCVTHETVTQDPQVYRTTDLPPRLAQSWDSVGLVCKTPQGTGTAYGSTVANGSTTGGDPYNLQCNPGEQVPAPAPYVQHPLPRDPAHEELVHPVLVVPSCRGEPPPA